MNKIITFTNSFHNTKVSFRKHNWLPADTRVSWDYIQYRADNPFYHNQDKIKRLRNRIKRTLCGIKDCTCGVVR